jgi:hypothetical protein
MTSGRTPLVSCRVHDWARRGGHRLHRAQHRRTLRVRAEVDDRHQHQLGLQMPFTGTGVSNGDVARPTSLEVERPSNDHA